MIHEKSRETVPLKCTGLSLTTVFDFRNPITENTDLNRVGDSTFSTKN
jgi:hypothetical protein